MNSFTSVNFIVKDDEQLVRVRTFDGKTYSSGKPMRPDLMIGRTSDDVNVVVNFDAFDEPIAAIRALGQSIVSACEKIDPRPLDTIHMNKSFGERVAEILEEVAEPALVDANGKCECGFEVAFAAPEVHEPTCSYGKWRGEGIANAALICRAVNAWDDVLALEARIGELTRNAPIKETL